MNLFLPLYSCGMGLESGWKKQDEEDKVQEEQFSSLGTYYIQGVPLNTTFEGWGSLIAKSLSTDELSIMLKIS